MKNYDEGCPQSGFGGGGQRNEEKRAGRGYSRPPLARMQRLHELLTENRYPNCRKIAAEFEVSGKTVQRDVNFMRDQMGLPIEYDKERFGFCYTSDVNGFPSPCARSARNGVNPLGKWSPPRIGEAPALGNGRGCPVRIRFDAESARAVRSGKWHPTQTIRSLGNGGVEMDLRAGDECQIVQWVLSWGAHAWIVEPAKLRARIGEIARAIVSRHA